MMTKLHATPYDTTAIGFYFSSYEEYLEESATHTNDYGQVVEEYEMQFIDGELYQLFEACNIDQCLIKHWFEDIETLSSEDQIEVFYRCKMMGEDSLKACDKLQDGGGIYEQSLEEYCYDFIEESGIIDLIPDRFQNYFNYDQYIYDMKLEGNMEEFNYRGKTYVAVGFQ